MWSRVGARCEVVMSQPTVAEAVGRNERLAPGAGVGAMRPAPMGVVGPDVTAKEGWARDILAIGIEEARLAERARGVCKGTTKPLV